MDLSEVLKPPSVPSISDADRDALEQLGAEFRGWWIGWSERLVPWSAKRRRGVSWTGGVWAVEATTAEMLRELLAECAILDAKHAAASPS